MVRELFQVRGAVICHLPRDTAWHAQSRMPVTGDSLTISYFAITLPPPMLQLARTKKACIVFFDEVDAIGGSRFDGSGGDGAEGEVQVRRRAYMNLDGDSSAPTCTRTYVPLCLPAAHDA